MDEVPLRRAATSDTFFRYAAGVAAEVHARFGTGGVHIDVTETDLPMARGLSPLAATLLAFVFLRELPSANHLLGIFIVCAGLFCLAFEGRTALTTGKVTLTAVLTGFSVGAYSVVDGYGVRIAQDWMSFTAWLVALDGGAFVLFSRGILRPQLWYILRNNWRMTLITGSLGTISFSVFVWALARAPVGSVAALREVSVLFASVIGVIVLGERFSSRRFAGATLVTAGVAFLSWP
jgi:drug/metabolite transporter (DMT)-like permease